MRLFVADGRVSAKALNAAPINFELRARALLMAALERATNATNCRPWPTRPFRVSVAVAAAAAATASAFGRARKTRTTTTN